MINRVIKSSSYVIVIFALFFSFLTNTNGQDVEKILNSRDTSSYLKNILSGDPFSLSGNYGFTLRSYNTDGASHRQTPLTSTLFANATAHIYNINIPFNFILNNLDQFSQPFHKDYFKGMLTNQRNRLTRLGFSPYYKWIKVHIGHRSMNFSDFSLSSHNFLGGGVELTPGKFRFSAMVGRLAKVEPVDLFLDRPNLPVYKRIGWGIKAGYGTSNDFIDLILFSAKDDIHSLDIQTTASTGVQPAENMVIALKGQKEVVKNLKIDFELARSGHTRDLTAPQSPISSGISADFDNILFHRHASTIYANAASANLAYQLKKIRLGVGYQRINPGYKTFGAYFFNDDLENTTLQFSGYGIGNFSFAGSAGLQRNNLDKSRPANYKRFIMSLNAGYNLKSWVFGMNYSNFLSNINYVQSDEINLLKVVIVTSDASVSISKNFKGRKNATHNIQLRGSRQEVNQNIESPIGNPATVMYVANLNYGLRFPSNWNINLNADINQNSLSGIRQVRYGIGARMGKTFFDKKLDLSLGNQTYIGTSKNDVRSSLQSIQSFRSSWRINKLHNLQLQISAIQNKNGNVAHTDKYSELVVSLGFQGRFEYKPFQKNPDSSGNKQVHE